AESGLSVTSLPFIERFTHAPLPTLGVKTEDLWPCPVLMSRMTHEPLLLQPEEFWDSSFSRYIRGGRAGAGYRKIPDVIGRIATRIATATSPTYTMLYITDPDHSAHTFGVSSEHTMAALRQLDYHLAELATAINGTARLIITADHGLVDVTEKNRLGLFAGDPLLELLVAPPSGDSRVAHFHVKPGNETTFTAQFIARFGEVMLLLTQQELEESSLLGPCALSPLAKSRFGDFIGIALHPISFRYYRTVKDTENEEIGRHSGFSPAEMRIPLILA
ncbi:MAG: alkaline phosphatase family protein, partial [bacterium]